MVFMVEMTHHNYVSNMEVYAMQQRLSVLFLFLISLFLSSCGGGGGGDAPQPQQNNSDWDVMVWEQDNWS